jgi:hypothetical protein
MAGADTVSRGIASSDEGDEGGRHVVAVGSCGAPSVPLAVILCELHPSQKVRLFRRRADELSRVLATILQACPDHAGLDQVETERA